MDHQRLVWFVLVSGESTFMDAVLLPEDAFIVQFRDAVKAKYDQPKYLKDIPASALLVYTNNAAFEEKEHALDPTECIRSLGSKEDMLLVLVSPHSPFTRSKVAFFNRIDHASESEDKLWLSFEQNIPSTCLKKLYIRESYRKISSRISKRGINKVIITGTPGIGKSLFLIYLLWLLVKEGNRVLFIYHPFNIYYDGNGEVFMLDKIPSVIDFSFWDDSLWCLFDAKGKKDSHLDDFPYELCNFILSTSPRREIMNDFKKPPEPELFYMPIWSEAELLAIAPSFPSSKDWHMRFEILGGIPRYVFEFTKKAPEEILEAACTDCSLDDCIKKIGINSTITEKSKVIHSLVHITATPPFTKSTVCYASKAALDMIVRNKGIEARHRLRYLLSSYDGNPLIASLCGCIFEQYAIELLEEGGNFTSRSLEKEKTKELRLKIPPSRKMIADRVLAEHTRHQIYVPRTKNYTAIDAWIPGIGAFQITVSKNHAIKGGAINDIAKLGRGGKKLYWLLPPDIFASFTKKSPRTIEQYAVKIPFPE